MTREAELLAPAGDFDTALAAFAAGADAVYCGLSDFSARAFAKNLSADELRLLVRYASAHGRRVYVTFNTLVDEDDFADAVRTLSTLEEIGPDALIVQDLGVARICRAHFPRLVLHASTQLVAHNLEGVLALGELGFRRVVLARELSIEDIASIARRCGDIELECFIHGALCYSVSGLCLYSALEKDRSGNRGKCAYCCRLPHGAASDGTPSYPFSMKDLALGADARRLADAGVCSLKIEGRMKSALYVASVTRHYRQILDGGAASGEAPVTRADLETVFSRRTTELYFNGAGASPVDATSLGHLGTEIGTVKRVTKDREGIAWLRFHTARALERHDGLQFEVLRDGRHLGMGIDEMRPAISRRLACEVAAGTDVEIRLTDEDIASTLRPGMKVYCSMSNAVKRMFPAPSFRPSDVPGRIALALEVALSPDGLVATAAKPVSVSAHVPLALAPSRHPEQTAGAVEKAFSKLGGTDYRLARVTVRDPDGLFAPPSALNDLRRELVSALDAALFESQRARLDAALADAPTPPGGAISRPMRIVRVRVGQRVPAGEWDEIVLAVSIGDTEECVRAVLGERTMPVRLALPAYTSESAFNRLRQTVRRLIHAGFDRWEASDLATLRMLRALGVGDMTADWTLYAFNAQALAALAALGVGRFVASPENGRENAQYLAESGYSVDFLAQQSTPLFLSLTQPAAGVTDLAVFRQGELWVTTRRVPRTFGVPDGAARRYDLSWDPS